jgi:acyl-CoA synthetase (AMP-forming)/AMP-acid ligase II
MSMPWTSYTNSSLGITEATALVASTYAHDAVLGSSGSLLPGIEARLLAPDGKEITQYDQPGELVIRSPALVMGYLHRDEATKETFRDGWLHTGDEVVIRQSPNGFEHIWITDRLKEMIKVKVKVPHDEENSS